MRLDSSNDFVNPVLFQQSGIRLSESVPASRAAGRDRCLRHGSETLPPLGKRSYLQALESGTRSVPPVPIVDGDSCRKAARAEVAVGMTGAHPEEARR